jgi:hypothetical protein
MCDVETLGSSFSKYTQIKDHEEILSDTGGDVFQKFIDYATDVKTLEFVVKGFPRTVGYLTMMEILSADPKAEERLRKTHKELSKRHDIVAFYQEASLAKTHVHAALLNDPYKSYKHQVIT